MNSVNKRGVSFVRKRSYRIDHDNLIIIQPQFCERQFYFYINVTGPGQQPRVYNIVKYKT